MATNWSKILAWIWKVNNLLTHLVGLYVWVSLTVIPDSHLGWSLRPDAVMSVKLTFVCSPPCFLSVDYSVCILQVPPVLTHKHSCTVTLRSIRSLYLNHPNAPQTHLPHCAVIVVRLWKYLLSCCCSLSWLLLVEYMEMGHQIKINPDW